MSRGRRYEEPKLNMKKVFAVIIAVIVFLMFIFVIKGILTKDKEQGKITSQDYFAAFKDNKWGVIDSLGNNVIDPSYEEMIIIPNSKNDVFLCVYDVDYNSGEYKTKVLNSKNEEIFKEYQKIEALQNNDKNNNLWYEDNVLRVQKDGKYGIINLTGKELSKCEYDEIVTVKGIKNALRVQKDGKYGIIDDEGRNILNTQYSDIQALGNDNKAGFIVKDDSGKYGIVDYSNNKVLDMQYDEIEKIYGNDLYVAKKDGKQVVVQKNGNEILKTGFDEIKGILKEKNAGVIYTKNSKYGIMDLEGNNKIDAEYEELKEAKSGIFIAKKDGKYGIIDVSKNEKAEFKYNAIIYSEKADLYVAEDEAFNNDILDNNFDVKQSGILIDLNEEKGYIELRQADEYKYYNFKFEEKKEADIYTLNTLYLSKKDGKYGFVDKDGKIVVDYIYDDATRQNSCGFVGVKKDGKWGSLDNKGNVVQEPTYDLDDYLKIDFIGRWHLGKDINMNYYNQI